MTTFEDCKKEVLSSLDSYNSMKEMGMAITNLYAKKHAIEFADWIGFHYYRTARWKWREIKGEFNHELYSTEQLYERFLKEEK